MKREIMIYTAYAALVLIITSFLSVQILEKIIRLPYTVAKKTGEFINILTTLRKGEDELIGEGMNEYLLDRLRNAKQMEPYKYKVGNSLHYHDIEWETEKPLNTYRIMALGDSMTAGVAVDIQSTWPKQLERKLNNLNSAMRFEVLNMGRGGSGTFDELEAFKTIGANYSPDMIILQYYMRDWISPEIGVEAHQLWNKYKEGGYTLPQAIESELKKIDASERIYSMVIYQIAYKKYIDRVDWESEWEKYVKPPMAELIRTTKASGIEFMVITWDVDIMENEEGNRLASLLSEHRTPLYDFSEHLPERRKCPSPTRIPDCHLNADGYEIVADNVLVALKEMRIV